MKNKGRRVDESEHRHVYILQGVPSSSVSSTSIQAPRDDRKISVVNVNPQSSDPTISIGTQDMPEIRKYKKRFNSEILCASLWGK